MIAPLVFFLLLLPLSSRAQIVQCENLNAGCTLEDFENMVQSTYNMLWNYVGILSVFFFMIGGLILILSGGGTERIGRGRKILGGVLIGVSLAFVSVLIVQFLKNSIGAI